MSILNKEHVDSSMKIINERAKLYGKLKSRYRIIKETNSLTDATYFIQKRYLFFWISCTNVFQGKLLFPFFTTDNIVRYLRLGDAKSKLEYHINCQIDNMLEKKIIREVVEW